jgi:hypothetical protein
VLATRDRLLIYEYEEMGGFGIYSIPFHEIASLTLPDSEHIRIDGTSGQRTQLRANNKPREIIQRIEALRAVAPAARKIGQTGANEMQREEYTGTEQRDELLNALKARFEKNMSRHQGLEWGKVQAKLDANADRLWSLHRMETTGGEPDVVDYDEMTGEYIFYDCSAESPKGRRSVCYDKEGQESRIDLRPANSAIDMAASMGIEVLTEEQYRELQKVGKFDLKTSNWIKTPSDIREIGHALFCDRCCDKVFVYHHGASYYHAARGFRGSLRV